MLKENYTGTCINWKIWQRCLYNAVASRIQNKPISDYGLSKRMIPNWTLLQ